MNFLKPVIAGMLFGAVVFFFPFFLLRTAAFIFTISLVFRLFARRRFGSRRDFGYSRFFADALRNRSEGNDGRSGWGSRRLSKSVKTEIKIA